MKHILPILFCTIFIQYSQFCSAQDSLQQQGYLFTAFTKGSVLYKNGTVEETLFNYNTNNKAIAFLKDNQTFTISNIQDIDTIYLMDKKFVAIDDKFYVVGSNSSMPLLISYFGKPHPLTATTDHTGTSSQATSQVSNTVSDAYTIRNFKQNSYMEFMEEYWLKKGDKLYKANNEKQFIKIFPAKEDAIKTYVATNNISFNKIEDIVKLNAYLQQ